MAPSDRSSERLASTAPAWNDHGPDAEVKIAPPERAFDRSSREPSNEAMEAEGKAKLERDLARGRDQHGR